MESPSALGQKKEPIPSHGRTGGGRQGDIHHQLRGVSRAAWPWERAGGGIFKTQTGGPGVQKDAKHDERWNVFLENRSRARAHAAIRIEIFPSPALGTRGFHSLAGQGQVSCRAT